MARTGRVSGQGGRRFISRFGDSLHHISLVQNKQGRADARPCSFLVRSADAYQGTLPERAANLHAVPSTGALFGAPLADNEYVEAVAGASPHVVLNPETGARSGTSRSYPAAAPKKALDAFTVTERLFVCVNDAVIAD